MTAPSSFPATAAMPAAPSGRQRRWFPIVATVALAVVLAVLPQVLNEFWTNRVASWIPLAIAALSLNLLTGYNGQISVGHGALYGLGAYSTAIIINEWQVPYLVAIVGAAVVCFVAGVLIGLPALRIKGLYLALITLALATLFPKLVDQLKDLTGGNEGLGITNLEVNSRGATVPRSIRFDAPEWSGLAADQWRYYFLLVIAAVCFVIVRNIVNSRAGRSIIAVRDNETAAEVSGVNVAAVKVFTFGVSAALAGVAGSLLVLLIATQKGLIFSTTFSPIASLFFLVAVVIGGAQSIAGPFIGAVFIGVFQDVITPELPSRVQPGTSLILGALLIVLMLVAPGGVVGLGKKMAAQIRASRAAPTSP